MAKSIQLHLAVTVSELLSKPKPVTQKQCLSTKYCALFLITKVLSTDMAEILVVQIRFVWGFAMLLVQ